MKHTAGAARYARALAEVVLTPGSGVEPTAVLSQLRGLEDLLTHSAELKHIMNSPAVASTKKRAVIAQLSGALGLAAKVRNFVYVVIDHRRVNQLPAICEAFEMAIDEALGFVRADVTSAQPLTDPQRGSLEAELRRLTGKQVRMQFGIDKSLIGGALARIGSTVYDGSVRGQLEALGRRLTTES